MHISLYALFRFDGPRFGLFFPDKKYGTTIQVSYNTRAYVKWLQDRAIESGAPIFPP